MTTTMRDRSIHRAMKGSHEMPTRISDERVFHSGEHVEPGEYRDIVSGAIVRVLERDELPEEVRIVRTPRLYVRVGKSEPIVHAARELTAAR